MSRIRTMIVLLAIAAFLATTNASFLNFTKENLRIAELSNPEQKESNAFLVNVDQNIEFLAREEGHCNVAQFDRNPETDDSRPVYNHPRCKNYLGIYIEEIDQFFCRVNSFDVKLYHYPRDKQAIRFSVIFYTRKTGPFVLEVPLFSYPNTIRSLNPKQLEEWADKYRVGLEVPVASVKLKSASHIKRMTIDFLWLNKLVTKGVTRSLQPNLIKETQKTITTYLLRPVLVEEDYLQVCKDLVTSLNNPPAESEGSN